MANTAHPNYGRRRAAQQKIAHYCDCGMAIRGNPGWASHRRANPDHKPLTRTQWLERQ